ncbi:MAG: hypothetical protein ACNI25_05860 [Halarcobacter sp.]
MTKKEIESFKINIAENILPHTKNMNDTRIKEVINHVIKTNPQLPEGFGNMLFEQIKIMKNSSKYLHHLNN